MLTRTNRRQRCSWVSVGVFITCVASGVPAQVVEDTPNTSALVDAIRAGGIPAAASLVGHYVSTEYDRGHMWAENLLQLAEASDLVVRVVVTKKLGARPGEITIWTDYTAKVVDWYQGPIRVDETVTLRMRGGFLRFPNGTTAWIRNGRVPPMRVGEEYVVFLRAMPDEDRVFMPRSGNESVYAFTADGATVPWAEREDSRLRKEYYGMPKSSFLEAVRWSSVP